MRNRSAGVPLASDCSSTAAVVVTTQTVTSQATQQDKTGNRNTGKKMVKVGSKLGYNRTLSRAPKKTEHDISQECREMVESKSAFVSAPEVTGTQSQSGTCVQNHLASVPSSPSSSAPVFLPRNVFWTSPVPPRERRPFEETNGKFQCRKLPVVTMKDQKEKSDIVSAISPVF